MKKIIISGIIKQIKKNGTYDNDQVAVIKYGLESIYITITKAIILSLMAILLGILKEFIIFLLIYNIIRMPSFGLHATKSWICLLTSSIIFILGPYLAMNIELDLYIKSFVSIVCLILIFKNAPADTSKRPIVNPKRRLTYKYISILISIIMISGSFLITDQFISNSLILGLVSQCFMISPTIYKIFKLPYNNYLSYQN